MSQNGGAAGERNTSVLKAAMDAIISMDHHGHIIEWNPAAEKTFGYTAKRRSAGKWRT